MEDIHTIPGRAVEELKKSLSEKRYSHSVRVMETAFLLADAWTGYAIDRDELAWAALFHDCAKEFSGKKRTKYVEQYGPLPCGEELMSIGPLAHGPVGALVLQEQFGIIHPDIHLAVAYHSIGHVDFTPLGWAVSLADFLEPGRGWLESREELLERACEDAYNGIRLVMNTRVAMQEAKGKKIHPAVYDVRNAVRDGCIRMTTGNKEYNPAF